MLTLGVKAFPTPTSIRLSFPGLSLVWAVGGADRGHWEGARFRAKAPTRHEVGRSRAESGWEWGHGEHHHGLNCFQKQRVPQAKVFNSGARISQPAVGGLPWACCRGRCSRGQAPLGTTGWPPARSTVLAGGGVHLLESLEGGTLPPETPVVQGWGGEEVCFQPPAPLSQQQHTSGQERQTQSPDYELQRKRALPTRGGWSEAEVIDAQVIPRAP